MTLEKALLAKSENNRKVVPGGDVVVVALYTKGLCGGGVRRYYKAGWHDVNPGKDAGILPGDIILSINGTEVEDSDHLTALINGAKETLTASILRDGREVTFPLPQYRMR